MLKKNIFQISRFLAVFTLFTMNSFAMTATKDTVYETGFPIWNKSTHQYEVVNDSVSLVNNSNDTLVPKKILVLLPIGKKADIGFDLFVGSPHDKQYQKNGGSYSYSTGGPAQEYQFFSLTPQTVKPNEIIFLSNFHVERCIACPTSSFNSGLEKLDTLTIKLIVVTNFSSDTLVLIGDVIPATSSIIKSKKKDLKSDDLLIDLTKSNKFNALGKRMPLNTGFCYSFNFNRFNMGIK